MLDQPLTRQEIAERVSRTLGVRMCSIPGGGWRSRRKLAAVRVGKLTYPVVDLLHLVGARGVVCADFMTVNIEGWDATILREDFNELAQAEFEHPLVHFLPYFDSFLLGHKEREPLVTLQHRPKVYRAQGWIATLAQPTATQIIDIESTQTTASDASEEAEVRELVENFGGRLQLVSLLAPTAAQDLQQQYSEFVSPTLPETWMSDVSKAPGRMVSNPWPDRIEITTLTEEAPDRYVIDGSVVEITSAEMDSGEAANKIPVQIVVEKAQGNWLITEYAQEQ